MQALRAAVRARRQANHVDDKPEHSILPQAWTYDVVRVDWHLSPLTADGYLDLTFRKGSVERRLRFRGPIQVKVDKGFVGQAHGLSIRDIRSRGWDAISIEVANLEQDPGITFYARDVVELDTREGA